MSDSLIEEIDDEPRETKIAALDELFEASRTYRDSKRFHELIRFIGRFRKYSPFNCCLPNLI